MKNLSLWTLLFSVLLFTSCDDNEQEIHYLGMKPHVAYADQEYDVVSVASTDSWKAEANATWLTLGYNSFHKSGSQSTVTRELPITLEPNTTGVSRGAYIRVKAKKSLSMSKVQAGWMDVTRPEPIYFSDGHVGSDPDKWTLGDNLAEIKVQFMLSDSANVLTDSVRFRLYDRTATISSDADWLQLEQRQFTNNNYDAPSFSARAQLQTARFRLQKNDTGAERKAVLTLRSGNGAETTVTVRQLR